MIAKTHLTRPQDTGPKLGKTCLSYNVVGMRHAASKDRGKACITIPNRRVKALQRHGRAEKHPRLFRSAVHSTGDWEKPIASAQVNRTGGDTHSIATQRTTRIGHITNPPHTSAGASHGQA